MKFRQFLETNNDLNALISDLISNPTDDFTRTALADYFEEHDYFSDARCLREWNQKVFLWSVKAFDAYENKEVNVNESSLLNFLNLIKELQKINWRQDGFNIVTDDIQSHLYPPYYLCVLWGKRGLPVYCSEILRNLIINRYNMKPKNISHYSDIDRHLAKNPINYVYKIL